MGGLLNDDVETSKEGERGSGKADYQAGGIGFPTPPPAKLTTHPLKLMTTVTQDNDAHGVVCILTTTTEPVVPPPWSCCARRFQFLWAPL